MGVEVDHGNLSEAMMTGHAGDVGPGNGVVATQHDRDRARRRHRRDGLFQPGQRRQAVARWHEHIADVDDPQIFEWIHAQGEVGT